MGHLDKPRIRQAFARVAGGFEQAAFLHDAIRKRLISRLDLLDLEPANILDLGAGTLAAAAGLTRRFPRSTVVALDATESMLRARPTEIPAVCGDAESLPFAERTFDLVFSNLVLHWCPDLPRALSECRRTLKHPGALCFATLGPDTLLELRAAWRDADAGGHVIPFIDMHDLGDLLVNCGFSEPVLDREVITVTYSGVRSLLDDLRSTGSVNALTDRRRGLTGTRSWQRMVAALEAARGEDGRFGVSVEVIYGQAWSGPGGGDIGGRRLDVPVEVAG